MKLRTWMFILFLFTGLSSALAQSITVKGNIVDENGEALPGVSIIPKSAPKSGIVSDIDGSFTLNVRSGEKLTFSFVGYNSVERTAAPQMNIKMEPTEQMMNDVVVVGYICNQSWC